MNQIVAHNKLQPQKKPFFSLSESNKLSFPTEQQHGRGNEFPKNKNGQTS